MIAEALIEPRFKGPPDSANGGYACGLLGKRLGGPFEVTLLLPPPLGSRLTIEAGEDGDLVLADDGRAIATGRATEPLELEPPLRPSVEAARQAAMGAIAPSDHPYPGCFVCGPQSDGGLEIFPGPLGDEGVHAAPFAPRSGLPLEGAGLAPEIVSAALDCPSFPWSNVSAMLLGRLSVELLAPLEPGEDYVVIGWPLESEGRKHFTAAALLGAEGDLLGRSRAIWIEPRDG